MQYAPDTDRTAFPDEAAGVQGKYIILGVLALAVAASVVSWIYYARLQRRPIELWGSRAAELMLRAPAARSYRLVPVGVGAATAETGAHGISSEQDGSGRSIAISGLALRAIDERDISLAPGFSHIRQSLIHDRSFAWDAAPCDEPARWEYAIEFLDQGEAAVVALAPNCASAALAGTDRMASIRPVSAAIIEFLREQYPATATQPAAR